MHCMVNGLMHSQKCGCTWAGFGMVPLRTEKIISSMEIGEAIKRRRKELGISQELLAEILDVSYQAGAAL